MFQDVSDEKIKSISSFVRRNASILAENQCNPADIFGVVYATHPSRFEFRPGDIELIKKLASHVKNQVESGGLSHFTKCIDVKTEEPKNSSPLNEKDHATKTHYFLQKLLSAADQNEKREKGGYRYSADIKHFAAYLRMLVGPIAYETLQKNLSHSLPSLPSTNRYVRSSGCNITEGILRNEELSLYLAERSLARYVCISEDATRITGRVQYDSKSNQIVGFVLPLNNQNGMPIPFAFPARDAEEILRHFSSNNTESSFLNVIMAQPMGNAPAFCLMVYGSDNKYTSLDVANRWKFINEELAKVNIKVLSFSSDSDPKYNKAMRVLSGLGFKTDFIWFSCLGNVRGPFYFQDWIHILTKLRNFLLRTMNDKKIVPFGTGFIRIEHLFILLGMFSKDKHQLTPSTLNPIDRQNFKSVLRICHSRVTDLLKENIKDSQATVIFLQIMRDICDCFMDLDLTEVQQLRKMWYPLFLIRIWRDFIVSNKNYTLKDNFLSTNCYACLELNAHSMVQCMMYLRDINKPELFKPHLFSSQPCENIFRDFRSMSSVYSTVTNCSMKEATSRFSNIQYQNHIIKLTEKQFIYPRAKKTAVAKKNTTLPSNDEIFREIEFCQTLAIRTARKLGLIKSNQRYDLNYACKINPFTSVPETELKPTKSHNSMELKTIQLTTNDLKNIQLKNYSAKVNPNEIKTTGPYVKIECSGNKQIVVKKTSLCWLLSTECSKLSSDRLMRVMHPINSSSSSKMRKRTRPMLYVKKNIQKKRKQKM